MLCERGDDGAVRVVLGEFGLAAKVLFEKLSEVRKLTTLYLAKIDHRWVTFISLKTINSEGSTTGAIRTAQVRQFNFTESASR